MEYHFVALHSAGYLLFVWIRCLRFASLHGDSAVCVVQQAVEKDEVQSLSITVGTQRRAVLEAIAFGTFLRDVESYVDQEYQLLTPILSSGKGGKGGAPPIVGL